MWKLHYNPMVQKFNERFAIVKEKKEFLSGIITYPPFWEFKDDLRQAMTFKSERKAKIILELIIQETACQNMQMTVVRL